MGERAESMEARIDAIVEWIRHFEEVHWHPTYEKQIDVLIDRNLSKHLNSKGAADGDGK